MIAYKVVRKSEYNPRFLSSATVPFALALLYEIGKPTRPIIAGSKIMVFDTFEHARYYRECNPFWKSMTVLECEVRGAAELSTVCSDLGISHVTEFWERGSDLYTMLAPTGTLGVDWCKPIRVVGE